MKPNSSRSHFAGRVDGASSYVSNPIWRANLFAQPGRIANPRCMSYTFFALKNDRPKSIFAHAIAFFAKTLLENLGKIPRTEYNAAQYQSMRRSVSTSSIERTTYARWQARIMAVCRNENTDECFMAMRETGKSAGLLVLQTQSI